MQRANWVSITKHLGISKETSSCPPLDHLVWRSCTTTPNSTCEPCAEVGACMCSSSSSLHMTPLHSLLQAAAGCSGTGTGLWALVFTGTSVLKLRNKAEEILAVKMAYALFGLFMSTRGVLKRTFYFSFLHSLFKCVCIKMGIVWSKLCEQIQTLTPKGWRHWVFQQCHLVPSAKQMLNNISAPGHVRFKFLRAETVTRCYYIVSTETELCTGFPSTIVEETCILQGWQLKARWYPRQLGRVGQMFTLQAREHLLTLPNKLETCSFKIKSWDTGM